MTGDTNMHLDHLEVNKRDDNISVVLVASGLEVIPDHFIPRKKNNSKGMVGHGAWSMVWMVR